MMIQTSEICVIIQGPLYIDSNKKINIFDCIKSVKMHLPSAQVIVSTWRDEKWHLVLEQYPEVEVIATNPPQPFLYETVVDNFPLQVASTYRGIKSCKRKFVLKMRADWKISSPFFLTTMHPELINILPLIHDPVKRLMLFTIPDFVMFGPSKKMEELWHDTIFEKIENSHGVYSIFEIYSLPNKIVTSPEQKLGLRMGLINQYDVTLHNQFFISLNLMSIWFQLLRNNVNIVWNWLDCLEYSEKRYVQGKFISKYYFRNHDVRVLYIKVFINKYVFFIFKGAWWKAILKIILFRLKLPPYRHKRDI